MKLLYVTTLMILGTALGAYVYSACQGTTTACQNIGGCSPAEDFVTWSCSSGTIEWGDECAWQCDTDPLDRCCRVIFKMARCNGQSNCDWECHQYQCQIMTNGFCKTIPPPVRCAGIDPGG